jgi:predicted nucleic acid-binding Zn ribbon protein
MPTYVYKFIDTGETIEIYQAFSDDALTEASHPSDGKPRPVKKVFTPVGVTFKGGGFYKNDSAASSKSGSNSTSSSASSSAGTSSGETKSGSGDSSSEKSASKAETKSETKTETKSEAKAETKTSPAKSE